MALCNQPLDERDEPLVDRVIVGFKSVNVRSMGPFPKRNNEGSRFALVESQAGAFGANSEQRKEELDRLHPELSFRIAASGQDMDYFAENIHARILRSASNDPDLLQSCVSIAVLGFIFQTCTYMSACGRKK